MEAVCQLDMRACLSAYVWQPGAAGTGCGRKVDPEEHRALGQLHQDMLLLRLDGSSRISPRCAHAGMAAPAARSDAATVQRDDHVLDRLCLDQLVTCRVGPSRLPGRGPGELLRK